MRVRKESIVAVLMCFLLIFGVIGCRLSGETWYNPKSYTWYNPFKSNEAPAFDAEGTAHVTPKPSLGAQPNITPPPGGYTSKEDEARFLAGKSKENSSVVVPQYGATFSADGNRVASANVPSTSTASNYPPTNHTYNPYGVTNGAANNGLATEYQTTPTGYQQTNFHYEQPTTNTTSKQPNVYTGSGVQENGTVTPPAYWPYTPNAQENGTVTPQVYQPSYNTTPVTTSYAAPNQQIANYSPYTPENTTIYSTQPTTYTTQPNLPVYNNTTQPATVPNNNYNVPTATTQNTNPAAGFTANPSNYQPTTPPAGF
ncbi:MAG: hypothetical protein LBE12_03395 [Planctomycetaceae bacterium]|jgi:hypothetical protein|nr:hypothetical protein [Planctomycetaceae bacterium]